MTRQEFEDKWRGFLPPTFDGWKRLYDEGRVTGPMRLMIESVLEEDGRGNGD